MTARRVTLTFDNGPTPGVTEHVLDVLAERGIRSTFFVIGRCLEVAGARALSERAVAEGHWVGNHTLTHSVQFGESTAEFAIAEIEGTQRLLGDLAHPAKLFRPFGGGTISSKLFSRSAVDHLCANGYTCVLWNSVPGDWENTVGWVETALADIARQDWTVVVIHDDAHNSTLQLPRFLDLLARDGVELRQDFPDSCVPIRQGEVRVPIDHLVVEAVVGS